jgi:hypothetical protein
MPYIKALRRSAALALAIAALASPGVAEAGIPLEIGIEARAGNIQFPWADTAPTSGLGAYPSDNYFWGGAAYMAAPLSDDASIRFGYETDPVLRNLVTGSIEFERGAARIAVGPFLGVLNTAASPFSAGLSTTIGFQWPGLAYVSLRSAGGLALGLMADASALEPQALAEIKAGFYVRNAIVSGVLTAKRFCDTDSSSALIIDSLTSYYLTIEAFKKNVPYTLIAKAGYELRSKYFAASSAIDSLGSLNLGLDSGFDIVPGVALKAGISTGIFVFGLDSLSGRSPDSSSFLFSATLGCVIKIDRLKPAPKAEPAAADRGESAATPASTSAGSDGTAQSAEDGKE